MGSGSKVRHLYGWEIKGFESPGKLNEIGNLELQMRTDWLAEGNHMTGKE